MAGVDFVWHLAPFARLTGIDVYRIMKLRQEVFIVEQMCPFPDLDDWDLQCEHLWALQDANVVAYLRLVPPALAGPNTVSLGRICTAKSVRASGIGRTLVGKGLAALKRTYAGCECVIGAQTYLSAFYQSCGFSAFGPPYLEDGIPHIKMKLRLP